MMLETKLVRQEELVRSALVADDDPIMRDILSSLLTDAGYKVFSAMSGREALCLASSTVVTIAFVDLAMPDGNGLQTCAALRKLPKWSNVPVVILTQYSIDKALKAALSAGASGFLCKPLVHSELLWCLEAHTGKPVPAGIGLPTIKELDPQLTADTVNIADEALPPVGSEWILRYTSDTLPDWDREGSDAKLTPIAHDISSRDQRVVPHEVAQFVDIDHAPDMDALSRIAKLFVPGKMARLLGKLAVSTEEILLILSNNQSVAEPDELERRLHNLAGTAGTLGCGALSACARKLEFDPLKSHQHQQAFARIAHATLKIIDEYIKDQSTISLRPPHILHVLIVDDIAMNREIAGAFLQAAGHVVTCVEGGAEAVAAVVTTDFNVVLMDVRMPGMDGLEATRRIRALDASRARVPIVALTAPASLDRLAELRDAGMDGHLAKPFDPDSLVRAVVRAALPSSAAY